MTPDPHADCCPRELVAVGYAIVTGLGVLAGAGVTLLFGWWRCLP